VNVSELKILVIGGASLNTLQGAENFVPGGAGMYTAMSAHRSGAKVTLYAPRPVPMPNALLAVNAGLTWLGPEIAQEHFAHFESHYEEGRANNVKAEFGTEDSLSSSICRAIFPTLTVFTSYHLATSAGSMKSCAPAGSVERGEFRPELLLI
jgi:hypothetical protein